MLQTPTNRGEFVRITIAQEIRKRRSEIGLTQGDLAVRSGLHRTYVSDVERGTRNVSLLTLSNLAAALGCSLGDLVANFEREECATVCCAKD
jgi:transcriptional regulator with XRE-family HTH domain